MTIACVSAGCSNRAADGSMEIPTPVTVVLETPIADNKDSHEVIGGTTAAIDVTGAPPQEAYVDSQALISDFDGQESLEKLKRLIEYNC